MGFVWLSFFFIELYIVFCFFGYGNVELGIDKIFMDSFCKILFIFLLNGKFIFLDEGVVWLYYEILGFDVGDVFEVFFMLYGNFWIVGYFFFLVIFVGEKFIVDDFINMFFVIGI